MHLEKNSRAVREKNLEEQPEEDCSVENWTCLLYTSDAADEL